MAIADAFVGLPIESLILDPLLSSKRSSSISSSYSGFCRSFSF